LHNPRRVSNLSLVRRSLTIAALIASICSLWLPDVDAKYLKPDLIDVPIERVIQNLEKLLKADPGNATVRFNLARAHAMAYASKNETAQVWKGREEGGIWFGYHPEHIPFTVEPTTDKAKLKAANAHLAEALRQYKELVTISPDNLSAALGYAWCIEQSSDKQNAIKRYRLVIDAAWNKEKDLKRADLGWHSITAEAAGYLIPLLDKNVDKIEINRLKERINVLSTVPRPITPIVIPLRDGLEPGGLQDHSADVRFDADGTGLQKHWTWISKDAGWLVHDPHHTGKITSALKMFGGVTFWMFWENGYEALRSLDDNGDLSLTGAELKGLAVWRDVNGNGVSENGEVRTLADYGIVAVSCRFLSDSNTSDRIAWSSNGVTFQNGSIRPTYDIVLHPAIRTLE
jgi:tetratricopeptide (TPR) repeat protein